jgi:hypothetical protein
MTDEFLSRVLTIATWLVIVGVFLEGAEIIEEIRERGWQIRNPFKFLTRFGFILLMIGLAGEYFASTTIHDRDAGRIFSLSREAKHLENDNLFLKSETKTAEDKIAEAESRTAGFEREAAQARLETAKLKAAVAWRTISLGATKSLIASLSAHPGSVNLRWADGDPEAMYFAAQFIEIFRAAHWRWSIGTRKIPALIFGIWIPPNGASDGDTLRSALGTAGLLFTAVPWPQGVLARSVEYKTFVDPHAPELYVGPRLPPVLTLREP